MGEHLLDVKHLYTCFSGRKGTTHAVNDTSFYVDEGETLGIVGESGSGKSVTAMSILGLLNRFGYVDQGEILYEGKDLNLISDKELNALRGSEISMIFQEPMTSLNPVFTVGKQIAEVYLLHQNLDKAAARDKAIQALRDVKIPDPEKVVDLYPHQLSGGMRQRVMIAMALACEPKLLIADEPTTALDVTIQAQILKLMNELKKERGTAILFITHDLGVIRQMADRVVVMYAGEVVESVQTEELFNEDVPWSHPYTEGLLGAVPRLNTPKEQRLEMIPGTVPDLIDLPAGCKFADRCKYAKEQCKIQAPELVQVADKHEVRCFYAAKKERVHG